MGLYLPVSTKGTAAIAVCDRCNQKMRYDDLQPDGNSPGLRVCSRCRDVKDPYRYPTRKTENISLRFPRPDIPLSVNGEGAHIAAEDGQIVDFPPDIAP